MLHDQLNVLLKLLSILTWRDWQMCSSRLLLNQFVSCHVLMRFSYEDYIANIESVCQFRPFSPPCNFLRGIGVSCSSRFGDISAMKVSRLGFGFWRLSITAWIECMLLFCFDFRYPVVAMFRGHVCLEIYSFLLFSSFYNVEVIPSGLWNSLSLAWKFSTKSFVVPWISERFLFQDPLLLSVSIFMGIFLGVSLDRFASGLIKEVDLLHKPTLCFIYLFYC